MCHSWCCIINLRGQTCVAKLQVAGYVIRRVFCCRFKHRVSVGRCSGLGLIGSGSLLCKAVVVVHVPFLVSHRKLCGQTCVAKLQGAGYVIWRVFCCRLKQSFSREMLFGLGLVRFGSPLCKAVITLAACVGLPSTVVNSFPKYYAALDSLPTGAALTDPAIFVFLCFNSLLLCIGTRLKRTVW